MPERRLQKARRSLPDGYQYGDARFLPNPFGALTQESRAQLAAWARARDIIQKHGVSGMFNPPALDWNVIEGEQHGDEWAV